MVATAAGLLAAKLYLLWFWPWWMRCGAVRQYLEVAEARLRLTSRDASYCCFDFPSPLAKNAILSIVSLTSTASGTGIVLVMIVNRIVNGASFQERNA